MFTLQKNLSFRATMIHDITYMDPQHKMSGGSDLPSVKNLKW